MSTVQIDTLIKACMKMQASDLHLRIGKKPVFRIDGKLVEAETEVLTAQSLNSAIKAITPERCQIVLAERGGIDFAFEMNGSDGRPVRFRANAFLAKDGQGLVVRRLPHKLLSPAQIGLNKEVVALSSRPRGLLLVTGPTGSGKTTTLASLIHHIANTAGKHIETIEEPTEYTFDHGVSIVTQREVPTHVPTFLEGLRQALRQDPDVIMVGEMRDLETTRVALSAAETGHLVMSTLHTSSAAKTIDRLVSQFPDGEQAQVRSQLSTALLGVVCQQLLPRKTGGRVAAFEVLINISAVANLIRDGKTEQIDSVIQTQSKLGMQLLDTHLERLVRDGNVTNQAAIQCANNPGELIKRLAT